jgi:hypothetical protein
MLSLSKHARWAGLLLLAGCARPAAEPAGKTIACAIDKATEFADVCTIERNGSRLVVRRPDGGFRQFETTIDGKVTALDGADTAQAIAIANGKVEAQIDGDRYRFSLKAPSDASRP